MTTTEHAVRVDRVEGDVMAVNSYVVHGPTGVVIVDGQLTVSDARKVRKAADAVGTPLAGVLITHSHPDHYAGIKVLLDGIDVPIIATERVAEVIRRDDEIKNGIVGPMMGAEWPTERVFPNQTVAPDAVVELGGLEFQVRDLGPGESPADSMWLLNESTVFAGDVAVHGMHAYLADGYAEEWLHNIDRLQATLPAAATLYVGHGAPAGLEILTAQRTYIDAFVTAVRDHLDDDEDTRRAAVVARMREIVPTDQLQFLMELSVGPFAQTLR